MSAYPSVRIAGATDVDRSLSAAFVDRFGGVDYPGLDDVLGDPNVDAIVNLTFPAVHADVTSAALHAGKHVHSEKPLAESYGVARSLVEVAAERGLRLSCSPSPSWARRSRRCGGSSRRVRSEQCASRTPRSTGIGSRAGTRDPSLFIASARSPTSACTRSRSSPQYLGPHDASPHSGRSSIRTGPRWTASLLHSRGAGLRRRGRRARERNGRASHRKLLRLASHEAGRD